MTEGESSYRQIMKATSIFGGVQIFNIIISIIRSKFIAVLLGPAGMGIATLLTSTTGLISSITNLGLSTSAVKNVAAADASGDTVRVRTVVAVLKRLVLVTGIIGAVFALAFAPWLSKITFGNKNYTLAFVWISFTVLLSQVNAGQLVVLQGMRKLQYLAKANLAGSAFGLAASVPIYYLLGLKGIIPAIIVSAFITLFFSYLYSSKVRIKNIAVAKTTIFGEGSDMIRMGFFLGLNSFVTLGVSYIIRIFISHSGGVDQVGLYNAGFAIINTYIGMVFSAMATDYFPRLSGIAADNDKANRIINQQAEIALLILAPILAVFMIYINGFVILFYSSRFLPIEGMIHWAALGIFAKAASWPIAYLLIAKGHTKLFFYNEVVANLYMLGLNMLGYEWKGLEGLGISFMAGYSIYFFQVFFLCRYKYKFNFERKFFRILAIQLIIGAACFLTSRLMISFSFYFFGSVLIIISGLYSFKELNKRLKLIPVKFLNKNQ